MAPLFYWYDEQTGEHLRDPNGKFIVVNEPRLVTEGNHCPGYSWRDPAWARAQLLDMTDAGIDIALIVWFGHEKNGTWGEGGLRNLLDAALKLEQEGRHPPCIGLFFDTSSFTFEEQGRNPGKPWTLDMTKPENIGRFYEMIKHFWSIVCDSPYRRDSASPLRKLSESRYGPIIARIGGSPVIVLYESGRGNFFSDWGHPLFDKIQTGFEADFGVRPRVFPDYEWSYKDTDDDRLPFDLNGGGYVRWRAAVYEPFCMSDPVSLPRKGLDTIQFGPGYDDRAFPGRTTNGSPVRSRDNGAFYCYGWQYAERAEKRIAMIESWNELHEGTAICESRQYGRKYIDLTRGMAARFKSDYSTSDAAWCCLTGRNADGLSVINEERGLYQIDGGVLRSSDQEFGKEEIDYICDPPPTTNGQTVAIWKNGRPCRRTRLPFSSVMYFDVKDEFLRAATSDTLWLEIEYCDSGQDSFALRAGDGSEVIAKVQKTGTGKWVTSIFPVRKASLMGRIGGGLNHMIYQKVACDFLVDSLRDGNEHIGFVSVGRTRDSLDRARAEALGKDTITPAATAHGFRIDAPWSAGPSQSFRFKVTAVQADGATDTGYHGRVQAGSLYQNDSVPCSITFGEKDHGHVELEASLNHYGENAIWVIDAEAPARTGRHSVFVPVPRCELTAGQEGKNMRFINVPAGRLREKSGQPCYSSGQGRGLLVVDTADPVYSNLGGYPSYYGLYVTVEYFDEGHGSFCLVYDSNDTFDPPAGEKIARTQEVALNDTKEWQRACIFLEDPFFGNRCLGGDFAIDDLGSDLAIRHVSVNVAPEAEFIGTLSLEAQPPHSDGSLQNFTLTVRDGKQRPADYCSRFRFLPSMPEISPTDVELACEDHGTTRIGLPWVEGCKWEAYDLANPMLTSFEKADIAAPSSSSPRALSRKAAPQKRKAAYPAAAGALAIVLVFAAARVRHSVLTDAV